MVYYIHIAFIRTVTCFSSIITIKLIKGENLPLVNKDETKAFVSVQITSRKTDSKEGKESSNSTNYQRTYKFTLSPCDFPSCTIRFVISRFDRFSRKYDIGYVAVSLAELGVDISRETFFTREISPWGNRQVRKSIDAGIGAGGGGGEKGA